MSLGTSNRDGGKTSESGHLRALSKIVTGDVIEGLNVVQRAAGVNMSVDVQVGDAFLRRSDGTYAHPVFNDAVYNQVISAADGSNPRRDIIVIYLDYGETPSTAVSNNTNGVVKIKVVNGTPAGSPVDPNGAAIQSSVGSGNPYSILGRVRVPAGQTSISNSLIDDLRTMITSNATTVNTAAVQDSAVTTAKIADSNVTTAKINDSAVTAAKTAFGGNYSTTEVDTGFLWLATGKHIFKKTTTGTVTGSASEQFVNSVTDDAATLVIDARAVLHNTSDNNMYIAGYTNLAAPTVQNLHMKIQPNAGAWRAAFFAAIGGTIYITVWYVK